MRMNWTRRDFCRTAAAGLAAPAISNGQGAARQKTSRPKSVIIIGGGIAGLCCGYELAEHSHRVTVLEAGGRPGGHVRTLRDPFADGLYADAGAEHFTYPGYDRCWQYIHQFGLTALALPRREPMIRWMGGKPYTEEMLADRTVLQKLGFSQREVDFLARHEWWELPLLFYGPYLDNFGDEYEPFGVGLDQLDDISAAELLKREKASTTAISLLGGESVSALHTVWHAAILKRRGVPLWPKKVFRIQGGNQTLTDTFAARLGNRLRLGASVERIEIGDTGVRVRYSQNGESQTLESDYLVCCVSAVALRRIPVTPPWPPEKAYAIQNMPYYSESRVVLQCRSRFWQEHSLCPNITSDDPTLKQVWSMAEEVKTPRGMLVGTAQGVGSPQRVLAAFRRYFPGHEGSVEQVLIHAWPQDPLAGACETVGYHVGELKKFWPHAITPWRRAHFAGAYCDNLNWGMEAATRSANRVAKAIDEA